MAEEKIEKGIISEEALEEIAGGINVSEETLTKVIVGANMIIGIFTLGFCLPLMIRRIDKDWGKVEFGEEH